MEKVINIGGKDVRLSNNTAWLMEYQDQFGQDIVPVVIPLAMSIIESLAAVVGDNGLEGLDAQTIAQSIQGRTTDIMIPAMQLNYTDLVVNVTWAMAKAADESIEPPKRWIRQFDSFPADVVVPAVLDLIKRQFVSVKNLKRLEGTLDGMKRNLQPENRSGLATSSSQESNED